jgi:hypothetical protein
LRPDQRPSRPDHRPDRPDRPDRRPDHRHHRPDRPGSHNWFNNNFWNDHGWHPPYWNEGRDWWRAATWAGALGWLGYNWATPYSYGSYYDEGYTYDDSQYTAAQPPYVASSYDELSNSMDNTLSGVNMESQEWMPMGVFALASSPDSDVEPMYYVQLALAKGGYLAGTAYNATLDQSKQIDGTVDPKTQRVTWQLTDKPNAPIIETGVFDLTQAVAPIKVYFQNGTTQNWYLVRQEQPTESTAG